MMKFDGAIHEKSSFTNHIMEGLLKKRTRPNDNFAMGLISDMGSFGAAVTKKFIVRYFKIDFKLA